MNSQTACFVFKRTKEEFAPQSIWAAGPLNIIVVAISCCGSMDNYQTEPSKGCSNPFSETRGDLGTRSQPIIALNHPGKKRVVSVANVRPKRDGNEVGLRTSCSSKKEEDETPSRNN